MSSADITASLPGIGCDVCVGVLRLEEFQRQPVWELEVDHHLFGLYVSLLIRSRIRSRKKKKTGAAFILAAASRLHRRRKGYNCGEFARRNDVLCGSVPERSAISVSGARSRLRCRYYWQLRLFWLYAVAISGVLNAVQAAMQFCPVVPCLLWCVSS
jgi:hypothetical protein